MKKEHGHTDTERLGLGRLGSQMENLKHPRNSVCLLYAVEHKGKTIAHNEQGGGVPSTQLNQGGSFS